jgi:sigma-B regulation protein RsbU (phosphoserine phosphatase)
LKTAEEIEVAAKLQHMLFPKNKIFDDFAKVEGFYLPHKSVGGDFYDFFQITKNEIVLLIGDVTGKGIAAGLTVSYLMAIIKSEFNKTKSLKAVVSNCNKLFFEAFKGEIFCTFLIASYNFANKELKYVNCGHHSPILKRNSRIIQLNVASEMLGIHAEINALRKTILRLQKGDQLLFFTDGLIENEFKILTEKEFVTELQHYKNENLLKCLIEKTNNLLLNDDVTLLQLDILQ